MHNDRKVAVGAGIGLGLVMGLLGSGVPAQEPGASPAGASGFIVEIEGEVVGRFSGVSGLSIEREVIEFREGGESAVVHKLPGPKKYGDITLKRGLTDSRGGYFHEWLQASIGSEEGPVRRNGVLVAVDRSGGEVKRWNFTNGWPSKYEIASLETRGEEVAVESITLVVERIELP